MNIQLSRHAIERMNRRGVLSEAIDVVCLYADRVTNLNNGAYVLSLSAGLAQELRGVLGNALISRCENLQLVVDGASTKVITFTKNATFRQGSYRPLRRRRPLYDPRWA